MSPDPIRVALSSASVYPASAATAFEVAARLGYDGLEIMVQTDPVSQDPEALLRLRDHYGVPVVAIHSPCLLLTQRVWSTDPWQKLVRAQAAAERLECDTVVVHPPFRWQREYAKGFVVGLHAMASETSVRFAVENMFPWRARGREAVMYAPGWDPSEGDYPNVTLDLSHTAVSGSDALDLAVRLGDRLAHVHMADGSGSSRDEHLIPGRGGQPCAALLGRLGSSGYDGVVVVEVSTRDAASREQRDADLAEALSFARTHLAGAVG